MPNQTVVRPRFRTRGQARGFLFSTPGPLVDITGSGGLVLGGTAGLQVDAPQVPSDVVVEVDFDNDGDFDEPEEQLTDYVLACETFTGRDWPSLLTGKASPGQLRATLNNADDRFNFFNTSSPLNADPFSLRVGRKVRVRTSGAASPDPVLLARDRFRRADGPLGSAETGQSWSEPLADDFTIVDQEALATAADAEHLAVLDLAVDDYYLQATIRTGRAAFTSSGAPGPNVAGLVYRYQDTSNLSLAVHRADLTTSVVALVDVVAGTPTTIASQPVEAYDAMTLGVLVSGGTVTLYLEGVPVLSDTAIQDGQTRAGIYAEWIGQNTTPAISSFWAWSGLPAEVEGILWTGDTSDLKPTVAPGPMKLATLEGRGWLSRPAGQRISPPRSTTGRPTGRLVGQTLAMVGLLHPPGQLDQGDVTTGAVGMGDAEAIEVARRFEETELGFLYESQEGPLAFESRTARAGATSQATFTDAAAGQFGYHALELRDWRREIVNQVLAGVAPQQPAGISRTTSIRTNFSSGNDLSVTMPATVNAGDLLLVAIAATTVDGDVEQWVVPEGWVRLDAKPLLKSGVEDTHDTRVFARLADGTEDNTPYTFATDDGSGTVGCAIAHVHRITGWFGTIEQGVAISGFATGDDPPPVFTPWGLAPTLFLVFRFGAQGPSGAVSAVPPTRWPPGYHDNLSSVLTNVNGNVVHVGSARRVDQALVEDPASFASSTTGFGQLRTATVAVRGPNGGLNTGTVTVQRDDQDSQDAHNSIRTHRLPSSLFADTGDAGDYADLVLDTFAGDRPIVAISFWATETAALRAQAIRRRLSHRITLVATGQSGMGIALDFFIESIRHRWSQGRTLWETTWELSPAE